MVWRRPQIKQRFCARLACARQTRAIGVMHSSILQSVSPVAHIPRFGIVLSLFALLAIRSIDAAKQPSAMALPGYKAVAIRYGPLNKMLMAVTINGHPANLIVDTGARQLILDSSAAESLGVSPARRGLRYVGFTQINGQLVPLGFFRSFTAGTMKFGSSPVALLDSKGRASFSINSRMGNAQVAGVFGTDLLTRYKAVINCRTRFIFFKVDASRRLQLADVALSQGFTRVPLRREANEMARLRCHVPLMASPVRSLWIPAPSSPPLTNLR